MYKMKDYRNEQYFVGEAFVSEYAKKKASEIVLNYCSTDGQRTKLLGCIHTQWWSYQTLEEFEKAFTKWQTHAPLLEVSPFEYIKTTTIPSIGLRIGKYIEQELK